MTDLATQVMALEERNQHLQAQWDHFQRLCRDHGANGIGDLIVQRDKLKQEREFLIANATRSVSWIDGVIEILELYRPETPGQREWQKRMIGEGYAIIQGYVEVRMLEDEK